MEQGNESGGGGVEAESGVEAGSGVGKVMAAGVWASGVGAVCAMLYEEEVTMQEAAISVLNDVCHDWWFQMSPHLNRIMTVVGKDSPVSAKAKEKGNILVAKILFHLAGRDYDFSLQFAVRAPERFLSDEYKLFVDKIMVRGLDRYKEYAVGKSTWGAREEGALKILTAKVMEKSLLCKEWNEAVGFAIECVDADKLTQVLQRAKTAGVDMKALAGFASQILQDYPPLPKFRKSLYAPLCDCYRTEKDALAVVDILSRVEDANVVSVELRAMVNGVDEQRLLAFQAALDLVDNAPAPFVRDIVRHLGTPVTEDMSRLINILNGAYHRRFHQHFYTVGGSGVAERVKQISTRLLRDWSSIRHPIAQTAAMVAHAFILMGSGNTDFLIDHIDWARAGVRWSEFTSAASVGIIFKLNVEKATQALSTILPKRPPGPQCISPSSQSELYSFGGGLFGLGLLSANTTDQRIMEYFLTRMDYDDSPLRVGLCLGLGTTAIGCHRKDLMEKVLKVAGLGGGEAAEAAASGVDSGNITEDWACVGMAGAVGAGLLMLGSGNTAQDRLHQLACETKSESVRRGLSVAQALLHWGQGSSAETFINSLCKEDEAELRRAGGLAAGAAYVASADTGAIDRLMRMAVTDVNESVRRTAATVFGLVISGLPVKEAIGLIVPLLCSYCPYTRYGGLMALAIALAGSGSNDALELLNPMIEDSFDFVRQGAMLCGAIIAAGISDAAAPAWKPLREKILESIPGAKSVSAKMQNLATDRPLLVFGAILSFGISYAATGNAMVSTKTSNGRPDHQGLLGLLLFTEHWNWFPYACFLSLSFRPLSTFLLNESLLLADVRMHFSGGQDSVLLNRPIPVAQKTSEAPTEPKEKEYRAKLSRLFGKTPSSESAAATTKSALSVDATTPEDLATMAEANFLEVRNGSRLNPVLLGRFSGFQPPDAFRLLKDVSGLRRPGALLLGRQTGKAAIPLASNFKDVARTVLQLPRLSPSSSQEAQGGPTLIPILFSMAPPAGNAPN